VAEALALATSQNPELVLLDLGLPDGDGIAVARSFREWSRVPIIVISARGREADKVAALDAGADDYLSKPFGIEELLARIRATLRRARPAEANPPVLHFGELEVDLERRLVRRDGKPIHVTPTEYGLLEAMVTNPGKLLTHQWLLRRVWGRGYGQESNYLRIYVRQLRRKLGDDAAAPIYVATEPGVGYRWIYEPDRE
jgi:two-component system KDP operon response regulator KdpE